eukprot:4468087-Amphidinium_carterae.1
MERVAKNVTHFRVDRFRGLGGPEIKGTGAKGNAWARSYHSACARNVAWTQHLAHPRPSHGRPLKRSVRSRARA